MPVVVRRLGGQTAAAWAQAIGSLIAIGGAILIGKQQSAAAREVAREHLRFQRWTVLEDHVRLYEIACGYLLAAEAEIARLDALGDAMRGSSKHLTTLQAALSALPAHQFPTSKSALALAAINATIGRYYTRRSDLVDELARGDAADAMRVKQLRRWMDEDRSALVITGVDLQLERNEAVRRLRDFGGRGAQGGSA